MGFLAPAFLVGIVAVGLPLYLHLLRRQSGEQRPFSSLMFLEPREQSAVRRRRLRYWLLLALRCAVLIVAALAFAEPYIERPGAAVSPEHLLVLAIDDSFSMRAAGRLAEAKREALAVLATRRPRDRAQVIALGSSVSALGSATRNPAELRAAVESIAPGDSRGSFAALASAVRSLAASERTPIELHLFSDMQKTGMPPSFAEMALPASVSLVLHPVARSATPNWAVESVSAPGELWSRTARVQAVIAGYGTTAATRTVSFLVNGRVSAARQVSVPAAGRAVVTIDALDVPYGLDRCAVRIDPADALPADDEYDFTIERADPMRGLFVHQASDTRSPLYFETALRAADAAAFNLDKVAVERTAAVDPAPYAFVVLSDVGALPDQFLNRLSGYVRRGGSVLIALGTTAEQSGRIPLTGAKLRAPHDYSRAAERFVSIGTADAAYPAVGSQGEWDGVKFFYTAGMDPTGSRVALRLSDGTPLLEEVPFGEGRIVLLASGLDNLTNDLPLHPVFVAFTDRLMRYLAGIEARTPAHTVDEFIGLRATREHAVGVQVIDPLGRRLLSLRNGAAADRLELARAGFYELHLANGRNELIAANADRRESDLAPMPAELLALWRGSASPGAPQRPGARATAPGEAQAAAGPQASPGRSRHDLWWYAMVLLLAAGLAESAASSRYLGTRREAS
ncbi:MAG: BatA domain-containing protein [Steroidobacteraceae bacterium]